MYRSEATETSKEFELIYRPEHIEKIEELIEKNFDIYFRKLLDSAKENDSLEKLKSKWGKRFSQKSDAEIIKTLFAQQIDEYEKEAESYRKMFKSERFEEYRYEENNFKKYLIAGSPVIKNSYHSRAEELSEWQKSFAKTSSVDLLDIFQNLIEFATDYSGSYEEDRYENYSSADDFDFDEIEEENYGILGVVGMGIKAVTLYHLYPQIFPRRGKLDLFGMYFLTDKAFLRLPTKTSEFIMVNDKANGKEGIYKVDQNYWYPYGLFAAYAMKLYRMIARRSEELGAPLDQRYRYVYVNTYLENICACHASDIQTLTQSSSLDRKSPW
ncbi:MAG: hypothetical protein Kow00121_40740 [Elainellaceae cyanobacterium]